MLLQRQRSPEAGLFAISAGERGGNIAFSLQSVQINKNVLIFPYGI
jgi:hypothetical protein